MHEHSHSVNIEILNELIYCAIIVFTVYIHNIVLEMWTFK